MSDIQIQRGVGMVKYFCAVNKKNFEAQKLVDSKYKLAGVDSEFNVSYVNESLYMVELNGRFVECLFVKNEAEHNIYLIDGNYYKVKVKTELEQIAEKFLSNYSSDTMKSVEAPMPGLLTKIFVNVGDKISIGDSLFELEAMK